VYSWLLRSAAATLGGMTSSTEPRTFAAGDRVRVRPGVTGGVSDGDEGTVHSVLAAERPVRVALDGDGPDLHAFEPDELELVRAAERCA
jgi:hypothetical protein